MANICANIGILIGILATVGIIYTLASKEWKKNSQVASQQNAIGLNSYEGLWVRCTSPVPGTIQCDNYDDSFLALPAQIQAMRAMMCLAIIFALSTVVASVITLPCTTFEDYQKNRIARVGGILILVAADLQGQRAMMVIATIAAIFGVIAGTVGLNCISAMKGTSAKVWTGRSGGILMILAGGLTLASVSWYAANVIYDFFTTYAIDPLYKFEFGSALYVGWVSAGLAIIAGVLLTCCGCGDSGDKDESYRYTYRPPQSNKPNAKPAEYV